MSTPSERRERQRSRRQTAGRERAEAGARRRRLSILAAIGAAALAAVIAIVVVASGGDDGEPSGGAEPSALFAGIPQNGTSLGNPRAPFVLTEFADLQCPFCRQYTVDVMPELIERYARTGRIRFELRLLRFIGPDSDRGARAAYAAAEQGGMWNFADAFYRAQGPENTGYADDDFLSEVAQTADVQPEPILEAVDQGAFEPQLQAAESEADTAGVDSTPSFTIARRGGSAHLLMVPALTVEAFEQALRPELRG